METYTAIAVASLGILSTPVCTFFVLFYYFPHQLVRIGILMRQYMSGMKIKYVGDENTVFCYGEKNAHRPDKTSIVFVHGFTSSKDQWVPNFKGLPKDLHLIAVDLPGHGASSIPAEHINLDLYYIVDALEKFLDLVGLADKKIHLVGSSLGGAVVAVFVAHHPERVEKLTMVCPAMQTPVNSEFTIQIKEAIAMGVENVTTADCKLLPTDVSGMKAMLEACCFTKDVVKLSDQIWKGFLHLRMPKTAFFLRLFKAIIAIENMDLLVSLAPQITVPTQLIWGKQDLVIHVSGAELLSSTLGNCQRIDLIDNCGHAIGIDRPGAFNKCLLLFIKNKASAEKVAKKQQ